MSGKPIGYRGRTGAVAVAAVILSLFLTTGCKKESSSQTADGTSSSPAAEKKLKMAGIVFQEDQFFRLVLFGMRDAAKADGVELLEGNSENKPEKEIELVNTYVIQKVDAILISPLSKEGSVAALKLAHDKNITIITNNTPLDADFAAAYIECSPTDLGQQTGKAAREYIEKNLGGSATVAVIAFKSQVPEQSNARSGGFVSEVTKLPGVKIVAEQDAWLPEMAIKKVGDILTAHPDVNIVYAANEGGTLGAVLAVKNANKAGKVAVFGTDSSEQLLTMLQSSDNILQAITSQRPVDVGRMAVDFAVKSLKGETVPKTTHLSGTLLSRTDPDGVETFAKQFKEWITEGAQ